MVSNRMAGPSDTYQSCGREFAHGDIVLRKWYLPLLKYCQKDYLIVFVRYCEVGKCRTPYDITWRALTSEDPDLRYRYKERVKSSIKDRFEVALLEARM